MKNKHYAPADPRNGKQVAVRAPTPAISIMQPDAPPVEWVKPQHFLPLAPKPKEVTILRLEVRGAISPMDLSDKKVCYYIDSLPRNDHICFMPVPASTMDFYREHSSGGVHFSPHLTAKKRDLVFSIFNSGGWCRVEELLSVMGSIRSVLAVINAGAKRVRKRIRHDARKARSSVLSAERVKRPFRVYRLKTGFKPVRSPCRRLGSSSSEEFRVVRLNPGKRASPRLSAKKTVNHRRGYEAEVDEVDDDEESQDGDDEMEDGFDEIDEEDDQDDEVNVYQSTEDHRNQSVVADAQPMKKQPTYISSSDSEETSSSGSSDE